MIKKKKKKNNRFGAPKTKKQIVLEYIRTIAVSFCFALLFTVLLSIHARSEMIKNLYADMNMRQNLNKEIAKQLVKDSDLTVDLKNKNFAVCMHIGNLYEIAQEYEKAQIAYENALEKANNINYNCYYKLSKVLIAQNKIDEARKILNSVKDVNDKDLIKFKTRSYIEMGDKYYSSGKFLSAAKAYEKAKFYYDKFSKNDVLIANSINNRIVNAYIETADVMVKSNFNTDAVRFLKRAEQYSPDNFSIKYKLAVIYSDLDPIQSVQYFEPLLNKKPQFIDYGVYAKALMKAANICELEGNTTKAKYYRYKISSLDIFINRKVIYKNDVEILLDKFIVKKICFTYRLKGTFRIQNISNTDMTNISAEFVLRRGNKILEKTSIPCVDKSKFLYSNGGVTEEINVNFGKNIFTKNELEQYFVDIYLYKDKKYKTLVSTMKVPLKSINNIR